MAGIQDVLDSSGSQGNELPPDDVSVDRESSGSRNCRCPRNPIPSESSCCERSQSRASELADAIRSLAEANQARNNMIMQQPTAITLSSRQYSIAKCIEVLGSTEKMSVPTYLKSIEKLQYKRWRETFEMPSELGLGWSASV